MMRLPFLTDVGRVPVGGGALGERQHALLFAKPVFRRRIWQVAGSIARAGDVGRDVTRAEGRYIGSRKGRNVTYPTEQTRVFDLAGDAAGAALHRLRHQPVHLALVQLAFGTAGTR